MQKSKFKRYLFLNFEFFSFLVFLSLFLAIFCQQSFVRRFCFSFLKTTLCSTWKKIQVQIIVFNKNAVVKTSRISNSEGPPWKSVKFRSKFFLVKVSRIAVEFFWFWSWINDKTIKTPGFYGNAYLIDVFSLTEIQYLQTELNERGTHNKENMILKMFYLYGFVRWTECIWCAIENNYLLVYKSLEVTVEGIPAIGNKAEIIFSLKNHLHYGNFW